jgi:hypothetical protein
MKKLFLISALILSSCASKQENIYKIIEQSGKIEIEINGKNWQSIKSTGSAPILVNNEDGIEQAMNVATLRGKANIVEFLNSDVSSSKKVESSLNSALDKKELNQKVFETIIQEAKGIIKYSYVIERQIKDGHVKVVVLLTRNISNLKINLSN